MRHAAPDAVGVFHLDRVPQTFASNRALGIVLSSPPANCLRLVGDSFVQSTIPWRVEDVGVDVLALRVVAPRVWWFGLHTASSQENDSYSLGRGFRATLRIVYTCRFYVQLALQVYLREPVVFVQHDVVTSADVQRDYGYAAVHDRLGADLVQDGAGQTE